MSYLVRAKKIVSYLFGCLALNGPQRELFGTFQVIEMNKISQEIFGNQPIFNFISELVLLRSGKNFKPCIQNLVGTSSKLPTSSPVLSIWEYTIGTIDVAISFSSLGALSLEAERELHVYKGLGTG